MEILFSNRKLGDVCASDRQMRATYGLVRARKVQQRLAQLRAAETLEDLRVLAPGHCHQLTQDRRGHLALDLDSPYRLIFKPTEWLENSSGGLDWQAVQSVVVTEITDYH